jgi:hypothetical protein
LSILNDSIKDDHALALRLPPKSNSLLEAFRRLEEGGKDFRAGQSTQFHFGRWQFGAPEEIRTPDPRFVVWGHTSGSGVRRAKAALSSGCKSHPATAPAGAIGAVMEVTKWLKPSISVSQIGDSASVQAATRVSALQAMPVQFQKTVDQSRTPLVDDPTSVALHGRRVRSPSSRKHRTAGCRPQKGDRFARRGAQ